MKSSNVRNEVQRLAQQMEKLAKQVQDKLSLDSDPLELANELARNSLTFVFTLGEMYALENRLPTASTTSNSATVNKQVNARVVSNPNKTSHKKYYNVRDSSGRFARV